MTERVSVIIPSLNMGSFLDSALRSIAMQSLPAHEVILVDCDSTDETFDVIGKHLSTGLNIKVINQPVLVPGAARNIGIAAAEGDLIAFLDADDIWPVGKLERQVRRLTTQPAVDMVSGYTCYFEEASESGLEPARGSRTENIFHVHVGACLYRKNVFERIGGAFDEDFLYSEDVDLMLRVREGEIPFTILRSVELYYRKHPSSMMAQDNPRKDASLHLAARKSMLRRRAAGTLRIPLRDFASYLEPIL